VIFSRSLRDHESSRRRSVRHDTSDAFQLNGRTAQTRSHTFESAALPAVARGQQAGVSACDRQATRARRPSFSSVSAGRQRERDSPRSVQCVRAGNESATALVQFSVCGQATRARRPWRRGPATCAPSWTAGGWPAGDGTARASWGSGCGRTGWRLPWWTWGAVGWTPHGHAAPWGLN
jgi:hypothetical protein